MNDSAGNPYRFWAFISYSHQDNLAVRGDGSTDHVKWANWIHEQLETFQVPHDYREHITATGEPMPQRFFPVFRDEAELPTSHDLAGQIRDALAQSRFLIVIASPRSASSRYVNEEVRYFRELGRDARILTIIIHGEPNVRLTQKSGWTAGDECFCPALVHPVGPSGDLDNERLLTQEPIAADVRVKDDDPPREMLASECRRQTRRELLDYMKLKVLAGLMGVGFDELYRRDKRRQLEEAHQRAVRNGLLSIAFVLLAAVAVAGAWFALKKRADADAARNNEGQAKARAAQLHQQGLEKLQENSRSDVATAKDQFAAGKWRQGIAYLGRALGADPTNRLAMDLLWNETTLGIDVSDRLPEAILSHHEAFVLFVAFSLDGKQIFTVDDHSTARVWDAATGREISTLVGHEEGTYHGSCFSPDGRRIVTSSKSNNTARVFDVATGLEIGKLAGHSKFIHSLQFSPDGKLIVTASQDETARVWDAATGRPISELVGHKGGVTTANFDPDSRRIVTASWDNTARVWDAATGQVISELAGHEKWINSVNFSSDGKRIVTASHDNTARIWDAETGREITRLVGHEYGVGSADFSFDGKRIVTASSVDDHTARVWDAETGRLIITLEHDYGVKTARFSPDGKRIVTASWNTARVWDTDSGRSLGGTLRHDQEVTDACFSPDGRRIATGGWDGTVRVWDTTPGRLPGETLLPVEGVISLGLSPDGLRIVTAGSNDIARVWDAATGAEINRITGPMVWVDSENFSPDGRRIVTASEEDVARVWDVTTGREIFKLVGPVDHLKGAGFSPNGKRIFTASEKNNMAWIWDADTGQQISKLVGHEDERLFVRFSPDSRRIFTHIADDIARVWDTDTGRSIGVAMQHEDTAMRATYFPNDPIVAIEGWDRPARVLDTDTGREVRDLIERQLGATYAHGIVSLDGMRIVTITRDNTARIWPTGFPQQSEDWLPMFAAAAGGLRFIANGVLEEVPMTERLALRQKLRALLPGEPGSTVRDRDWARLLKWWLEPPPQRPSLF